MSLLAHWAVYKLMFKGIFFDTCVFKTHRRAVYQCLKKPSALFRHASVFLNTRRRPNLYFFHHSFCKFKRERSENVSGKSDFHWPLMFDGPGRSSGNALSMPMSSLSRVLFLLCSFIFLQTDGLRTDGSRLFRNTRFDARVSVFKSRVAHLSP